MNEISGCVFSTNSSIQAHSPAGWAPPAPPQMDDSLASTAHSLVLRMKPEAAREPSSLTPELSPLKTYVSRQTLPPFSAPNSLKTIEIMAALCTLAAMHDRMRAACAEQNLPQMRPLAEHPWWNISETELQKLRSLTQSKGDTMIGYVLGPEGTVFQWTPKYHVENTSEHDSLRTIGRFDRNGDYIPFRQLANTGVSEYRYELMVTASTITCWKSSQIRQMTEPQTHWCWAV